MKKTWNFYWTFSLLVFRCVCASDFKWKQFSKMCAWAFHSVFLGIWNRSGLERRRALSSRLRVQVEECALPSRLTLGAVLLYLLDMARWVNIHPWIISHSFALSRSRLNFLCKGFRFPISTSLLLLRFSCLFLFLSLFTCMTFHNRRLFIQEGTSVKDASETMRVGIQ